VCPATDAAVAQRLLPDLLDLSRLVATGDLEQTLQHVARVVVRQLADADLEVGVSLVRDGRLETGTWLGEAVVALDSAQYDDGDGPCVAAIATGERYAIPHMDRGDRWPRFRSAALAHGVRSSLSLPLVADGETLGALNVYAHAAQAFDGRSLVAGDILAAHAALALGTARAYARAREAASTLQRRLLPRALPAVPGARTAVRYLPASAGTRAGGDWYEVVATGPRSLALAVGDVGGHGLPAAAVMGQLRIALRAYLGEGHRPATALGLLHDLFSDLEPDLIATACCLTLDGIGEPVTDLRWASAGHPPPLLRPADGTPTYLEASPAPPVGAPGGGPPEERRHILRAGSTLVLYTDGLVERRGRSLDDGLRDLAAAAAAGPRDPDALCDHLLDALLPARTPEDDVALLALTLS